MLSGAFFMGFSLLGVNGLLFRRDAVVFWLKKVDDCKYEL